MFCVSLCVYFLLAQFTNGILSISLNVILHLVDTFIAKPWNFPLWPSREVLTELSDKNLDTCVSFTPVEFRKRILLKTTYSPRFNSDYWRIWMLSKNLALSSECEPSLMMTQLGISDNTDESLCRPFCGKLVRGNVSMHSNPYQGFPPFPVGLPPSFKSASWDLVIAQFPCNYRNRCKGIFVYITEKALVYPTLNLEICEIGQAGYYYLNGNYVGTG